MKFISWLVFIGSIFCYLSVFISPEYFIYAGLLPFFIPVTFLVNSFLFAILALAWRKLAFLHLIALLLGLKFALITVQIHPKNEDAEGLKVLSYNVHLFDYKRSKEEKFDPNVYTWLQEHPADVKVFQEFYQDYTSASRNSVKLLGKNQGFDVSYHIIEGNPEKRSYGMAIFSK